MKKKKWPYVWGALCCLMSVSAIGQIHSNSCDTLTAGWIYTNSGGGIQKPNYWLLEDGDTIVSEAFNVSSYSMGTVLSFKVGTFGSGSTLNGCFVDYSTDNGVTWNTAQTFTSAIPTSSTYISSGNFNISASSSTQFKLRFRKSNTGGRDVRLDDISFFVCTPATITTPPSNQLVVTEGTATFTVAGTSDSWSWEVNDGNGWQSITNGGVYSGAATASLFISQPPDSMSGYQYRATAHQSCSNTDSVSSAATLTVGYLPSFKLVTDTAALVAGKKYVIAKHSNGIYALGMQQTNNRAVATTNYALSNIFPGMISFQPSTQDTNTTTGFELTLDTGNIPHTWALYDSLNNGYLYTPSSSNNYLQTTTMLDSNGSWSISFSGEVAHITANGSNRPHLRQNNSGGNGQGLFSCYGSSTSVNDIYLYRQAYKITYDANGGTNVPLAHYEFDDSNRVLADAGSIYKTGYTFNGWNTQANGSGTHYNAGATNYTMAAHDTLLYAEWLNGAPALNLTGNGTPATSYAYKGFTNVALFGFELSANGNIDFTSASITTGGNATGNDLSNFRLYYDVNSNGAWDTSDVLIGGAGIALANPLVFNVSGQTAFSAARRYLLVADVSAFAVTGHTFSASMTANDMTTTGSNNGSASGNVQTIRPQSTDYFRTIAGGNWNNPAIWESTPDSITWSAATVAPLQQDVQAVIIRDSVMVNSPVTIDQLVIENGALLICDTIGLVIANGVGIDVEVKSGGVFAYYKVPDYTNNSDVRIRTGATLRMLGSGMTDSAQGVNSVAHVYEDASVLEWANNASNAGTPSSINVTFFPHVNAATVPIFRFSAPAGSWGSNTPTTVNGKLEIAGGITLKLQHAGTKTFRNGITGAGRLNQNGAGTILINGGTAELGDSGTIALTANGMRIDSNTVVVLSADKLIEGTGTLTIATGSDLVINGHVLQLDNAALAGGGTLSGSRSSELKITNTAADTSPFGTVKMNMSKPDTSNALAVLETERNLTIGTALSIYSRVDVGQNATLTTGGNLTLKSDSSATARVDDLSDNGGGAINGEVTVERHLPSHRAWRLIAPSVASTTQSIHDSWQEGGVSGAALPGYGVWITRPGANPATDGYDASSNGTSLQYWDAVGNTFTTPSNTDVTKPTDYGGAYSLFVRGDRTVTGTGSFVPTTLRVKGNIYSGNVSTGVMGPDFSFIPNPYPSSIDYEAIAGTAGDKYYVWDVRLGSIGAYRTVERTAPYTYQETPSGGTQHVANSVRYIQSGQAFFIPGSNAGGPSVPISFNENMKTASVPTGIHVFKTTNGAEEIAVNLNKISATDTLLADGLRIKYDVAFDSAITTEDIGKRNNINENLSVHQNGIDLVVTKLPLPAINDTVQFRFWNPSLSSYRLSFEANNISSFSGIYLLDNYLNTLTSINTSGNSIYDFTVTNVSGSYHPLRFALVFSPGAPLPVDGIVLYGKTEGKTALLNWTVQHENDVHHYEVQHSSDAGKTFTNIGTLTAKANNSSPASYAYKDENMGEGNNLYRIKSVATKGEAVYSNALSLFYKEALREKNITVFPNPVSGNILNIRFHNLAEGAYAIALYSATGTLISKAVVSHSGNTAFHTLSLDAKTAAGVYKVKVMNLRTGVAYTQSIQVQ